MYGLILDHSQFTAFQAERFNFFAASKSSDRESHDIGYLRGFIMFALAHAVKYTALIYFMWPQ